MSLHEIHSWTLIGLIRAFLDLAVVYFLLCISATVFIPSKILKVIGLCLPCPCTGFYGFQSGDFCLHKLFISWPKRKIFLVLDSVVSRFPFDLILIDEQMENRGVKEIQIPLLESEPCSSSFSGKKLGIVVDDECGLYDGKGKRVVYQRPKTKIRRRRRVDFGNGKLQLSRILLNDNLQANETRKEGGSLVLGERECFISDDINESNHTVFGEKTWHGFESSGSVGDINDVDNGLSSLGYATGHAQERDIIRCEANSIRLLEQALEKEKAAQASLYLELEEERAAAATAADEAIAMISRLQNDKAAIEMEARQYQRLIEEKFAYDEEEMNILREVLVRREIDNHVLEKEIEAYRQMGFLEKEQSKRNCGYILDGCREPTIYSNEDALVVQQIENANSLVEKTKANESTSYNSQCLEKKSHFSEEGVLKKTIWTGKDKGLKDNGLVCEHITTEEALCGDFDENYLSHGELQGLEHIDQVGSVLRSSILDMEIDVQDIHVIDEKLHMRDKKEENKMDN